MQHRTQKLQHCCSLSPSIIYLLFVRHENAITTAGILFSFSALPFPTATHDTSSIVRGVPAPKSGFTYRTTIRSSSTGGHAAPSVTFLENTAAASTAPSLVSPCTANDVPECVSAKGEYAGTTREQFPACSRVFLQCNENAHAKMRPPVSLLDVF